MPIWFSAKKYGYGWTPCTWQGWLVIMVYVLFCLGAFIVADSHSHSGSDTLVQFIPRVILFTFILLAITYKTGEKARWRWGK